MFIPSSPILLVPTKNTIVVTEITKRLLGIGVSTMMYSQSGAGRTSLLGLIQGLESRN